jgi:tRNA(fMet)-specific endonuclease VapC
VYGRLRADLERNGKPLTALDLLIASHALSEGCALVTADQAFAHVDELTLEAW